MIRIQLPRVPLLVPRSRRVVVGIEWRAVEDLDAPPSLWDLTHAYFSTAQQTTRYVRRRVFAVMPKPLRKALPPGAVPSGGDAATRWMGRAARRALAPVPGPGQVLTWPVRVARRLVRSSRPAGAGNTPAAP